MTSYYVADDDRLGALTVNSGRIMRSQLRKLAGEWDVPLDEVWEQVVELTWYLSPSRMRWGETRNDLTAKAERLLALDRLPRGAKRIIRQHIRRLNELG